MNKFSGGGVALNRRSCSWGEGGGAHIEKLDTATGGANDRRNCRGRRGAQYRRKKIKGEGHIIEEIEEE